MIVTGTRTNNLGFYSAYVHIISQSYFLFFDKVLYQYFRKIACKDMDNYISNVTYWNKIKKLTVTKKKWLLSSRKVLPRGPWLARAQSVEHVTLNIKVEFKPHVGIGITQKQTNKQKKSVLPKQNIM